MRYALLGDIHGNTEALTQVLAAANANTLPDLAVLDGFWMARVYATGKLQPLDDMWSAESRAKFYPQALDAVTFDGKVYGAWFFNAWRGNYYKKDEFAKLGFDNPPQTWDEYLKLLEAAKAAGVKSPLLLPGVPSELTALHMLPIYWGLGGELVDDTGKPVFFEGENRAKLEQVYQIYQDLAKKGYLSTDIGTMDENAERPYFYSGEATVIGQSSSSVMQIYADKPELENNLGAFATPIPTGQAAVPVLVGWNYGIFATDPEKKAAAWKFVEFFLRPENLGKINAISGQLPIVESIWDQDYYKNSALMQQFKAIYESGGMRARPAAPIYPTISLAWAQQMADVVAGNITPAQAVDNARDQVMQEYDRMSTR